MRSRSHDDAMAELYSSEPALALEVLNNILGSNDQADLLTVLRQLTKAFGGLRTVAEEVQSDPTELFKMLSPDGDLTLSDFTAILKAMDLRLVVQPIPTAE